MTHSSSSYHHKFSIVCCARWEHQDIVEWVMYHQALGFDHIYLFSNDDDPMQMIKALVPFTRGVSPFVTLKHFPKIDPTKPQQADIYKYFFDHYLSDTEWFCFLDVDEFFVLRGIDNIHRFMERFENKADAVYFNWVLFGYNGKIQRDDDSILLSHTARQATVDVHTKMITRSSKIDGSHVLSLYRSGKKGFWHFWSEYEITGLRQLNVLEQDVSHYGIDFPNNARKGLASISANLVETAFVAHFQFRSEEDFIRRVQRGGSSTNPLWRKKVEEGSHIRMLANRDDIVDSYLANFWLSYSELAYDVALTENDSRKNLALRRPVKQSSYHRPDPDEKEVQWAYSQGHANNGVRNGRYGVRTSIEDRPWWMVDLLHVMPIETVRIHKPWTRPDLLGWIRHLAIETSIDGKLWKPVFEASWNPDEDLNLSKTQTIQLPAGSTARYVRLSSTEAASLAVTEIEIYGPDRNEERSQSNSTT